MKGTRNIAIPVGHKDVIWPFASPAMSSEYKDLGFPSCSFLLGKKSYLLAQGGLLDLAFQCLDFLYLPSHQLNLFKKRRKKKERKKRKEHKVLLKMKSGWLCFSGFRKDIVDEDNDEA